MSDFVIENPGPSGVPFALVPTAGYTRTAAERAYTDRLQELLHRLSAFDASPAAADPRATLLRDKFVAQLREAADTVVATPKPARDAAAQQALYDSIWDEGIYTEQLRQLTPVPFSVKPDMTGTPTRMTDIQIGTFDITIPADKQQFKVQLDQALLVVKTVLTDGSGERAPPRADAPWLDRLAAWATNLALPPPRVSSEERRSEYLRELLGIAQVGLMTANATQTPFAALALTGFKDEFVAREAGRIKNRYVRKLGLHAVAWLLAASLAYVFVTLAVPLDWTLYRFRNFFLLAGGAAVGTWLSFSIRRQVLTFADLITLEDDRLNPGMRGLFMIALTTVVGLILWTGMVVIKLGDFRTDFRMTGTYAALIGALCGIAERSLAGAVGRRAGEFASGIGGGPKTTV